jgi:hypothetical protein
MVMSVTGGRLIALSERSDDLRRLHRTKLELETCRATREHETHGHKRLHHQQGQQPEQTTLVEATTHGCDIDK